MKKINRSHLRGSIVIPGSKSLTNRALLLAMVTPGTVQIERPLDCDDSRYMLGAIKKLGFSVEGSLKEGLSIGDRVSMYAGELELFVGNAGTAMRFLAGMLPFVPGRYLLDGDSRMRERPIEHLVEALGQLDAEIDYAEREGYPPLAIRGRLMKGGGRVVVDGSVSSQFVSALMMAGASLPDGLMIEVNDPVSRPYIDLTAGILRAFGGKAEISDSRIDVAGPLAPVRYVVEPDYSSASYWVAAAVVTGSELFLEGIGRDSTQGDARFIDLMQELGAEVDYRNDGVVVKGSGSFAGGRFDLSATPDLVPTLAAIAPLARDTVEIVNVGNLRVKESDRLAALESELSKLGAEVETGEDSIRIDPGWSAEEVVIDPHDDHRIAMAFAVAGLARGGVSISNPQVVAKSYPGFWRSLEKIGG